MVEDNSVIVVHVVSVDVHINYRLQIPGTMCLNILMYHTHSHTSSTPRCCFITQPCNFATETTRIRSCLVVIPSLPSCIFVPAPSLLLHHPSNKCSSLSANCWKGPGTVNLCTRKARNFKMSAIAKEGNLYIYGY